MIRGTGRCARPSQSSFGARSTQPFGEQIIGGNREEESDSGEEGHPPGLLDVVAGRRQDASPGGGGSGQSDTQKRKGGLREDRVRDSECGRDEKRRQGV